MKDDKQFIYICFCKVLYMSLKRNFLMERGIGFFSSSGYDRGRKKERKRKKKASLESDSQSDSSQIPNAESMERKG